MFILAFTLLAFLSRFNSVVADFHLMSVYTEYITCPSDEYSSKCYCYGDNQGQQVSNSGSVVHMRDVCGYGDIFLDWDSSSNSMAIYDAGNTYIGWCYYNYGFVDNCIYPGGFLSVYDTYTCITFLCNGVSKRSIPENTTADGETIPGTPASIGDGLSKRSIPENTTADGETIPGTPPYIGQE